MGSYLSRDINATDNQDSTSDDYQDEDPPADDDTVKSARDDDYEERVSPTYNEVAGNFPEIADLLLPRLTPLDRTNLEKIQTEDENYFQTLRQKRENENGTDISQIASAKVQAPDSATSRP